MLTNTGWILFYSNIVIILIVCNYTQASFQTGRLPVHVTETNDDGLEDPTHGIPTEMTTFASKLKQAGYNTHLVIYFHSSEKNLLTQTRIWSSYSWIA